MTQLSLDSRWNEPLPPNRGGSTQIEAAKYIQKSVTRLHKLILEAIDALPAPTNDAISEHTGLKIQTVCGRIFELREHLSLIRDSGARAPTRSGVRAIVWKRVSTKGV